MSGRSGEQLCLLALTGRRRTRTASSLGGRERGSLSLAGPVTSLPRPEKAVSLPTLTQELQGTTVACPLACPAPGSLVAVAQAGCLPGVLSALGWAGSVASVPGSARPTLEGAARGLEQISWVWPVTQQPWHFQATVRTARCGGCFPRDRRLLAPLCSWPGQPSPPTSPLRPDHASGLDFCRLLCGGREGRHHGWSGELGLDPLAPTPEASTVHSGAGCSELQGCPRSPGPPRIFSSVSHLNQHWPGTAP